MAINLHSQIAGRGGPQARVENPQANTANTRDSSAAAQSNRGAQTSTVSLSDTAQTLKNAQRKMADTPDIDQSKVDRLKAAIDSGDYKIDADRIAAGIMDMDRLLG